MSQAMDTLKKLLPVYGPSGREDALADVIEQLLAPHADEIRRDALGNLIAVKRGGGRKLQIAAHMDQIGLMATHIDDHGFIRVTNVGGIRPHWQLFTAVRFANGTQGVVGYETKTVDTMEKLKMDHLFVDIGARTRAEAEEKVAVGDLAMFVQTPVEMGNRFACGYMDDRVGCAILAETFLRTKNSPYDLYAVFTVQEEVGAHGARVSSYAIAPEMALAIDVTLCPDTPEAAPSCSVQMGKGPAIKVKDSSLLAHPKVRRWLQDAAKKANIPTQMEVLTGGGTDAGAMQVAREGVPSGCLSIATRYVHSTAEMIDITDYEQCIDLLVAALQLEA